MSQVQSRQSCRTSRTLEKRQATANNQPTKIDRSFSIGELVAYVTAWAIVFGTLRAAWQQPYVFGSLAIGAKVVIAVLVGFTLGFLLRGRECAVE